MSEDEVKEMFNDNEKNNGTKGKKTIQKK
jgi:hypothetical protein